VSFVEVWQTLHLLSFWQIIILILANCSILLLFSGRWWLILRFFRQPVGYVALSLYRLAGFGISYFTPGTQFGGEPVQVLLLQRRHQVGLSTATSSVFLDKLIEVIANFTFLILGLVVVLFARQTYYWQSGWMLLPIIVALISLVFYLFFLLRGQFVLSQLLRLFVPFSQEGRMYRLYQVVQNVEAEIIGLSHQKPLLLVLLFLISMVVWIAMAAEYYLVLLFLGLKLDWVQTVIAMTLARLALLPPLPGALGSLEVSQVLAMQLLGYSPAIGISLVLLNRGRDIFFGGVGLLIGSWSLRIR